MNPNASFKSDCNSSSKCNNIGDFQKVLSSSSYNYLANGGLIINNNQIVEHLDNEYTDDEASKKIYLTLPDPKRIDYEEAVNQASLFFKYPLTIDEKESVKLWESESKINSSQKYKIYKKMKLYFENEYNKLLSYLTTFSQYKMFLDKANEYALLFINKEKQNEEFKNFIMNRELDPIIVKYKYYDYLIANINPDDNLLLNTNKINSRYSILINPGVIIGDYDDNKKSITNLKTNLLKAKVSLYEYNNNIF
jgi:hypothetical protein